MARSAAATSAHPIPCAEALPVWLRIAALSFGGPAGQIAVMHRILVEEKRWISDRRFLHALNYCMLLPGPEAQQLATYSGWLLHGIPGGIMAGGLFILPGAVAIMALSLIYAAYGHVALIAGLFFGLKPAVLAVVLAAVRRLGRRALRGPAMIALAAAAFAAIFFAAVPFPLVILVAFAIGFAGGRAGLPAFQPGGGHAAPPGGVSDADSVLGDDSTAARASIARALKISAVCLALWLLPVAALLATLGQANVFSEIATFFARMAVVTFGGAYAVLAYVAQQAVATHHWLLPGQMLDGLGMAETTPGPLIMVLQFVGFMAAFHDPGRLPPLWAGALGGLLATWVTFAPCFLWIFAGAPFIETLRGARALNAGMAAITAAVVGVILNLALWFALHTLFRATVTLVGPFWRFDLPVPASVDPVSVVLAAAALVAVFRFGTGTLAVLSACALAGAALFLAGYMG
jgi:chromate transporter